MRGYDDFDLDRSTARVWSRFRAELADHIVAMGDDDVRVVDAESSLDEEATVAPYVQFCSWVRSWCVRRCRATTTSTRRCRSTTRAKRALVGLGRGSPTHTVEEQPEETSMEAMRCLKRRLSDII